MKWIKASEPPKNSDLVNVRYGLDRDGKFMYRDTAYYEEGIWKNAGNNEALPILFVKTLEWLEESALPVQAISAEEMKNLIARINGWESWSRVLLSYNQNEIAQILVEQMENAAMNEYGSQFQQATSLTNSEEEDLVASRRDTDGDSVASLACTDGNSIEQDLRENWSEHFGDVWMRSEWRTPLSYIQAKTLGYRALQLFLKKTTSR